MGLFTKGASEYRKGLKAEEVKDYANAFKLYEESAEKGYAPGCYKLAVCYAEGLGTEQNYYTALSWAKDADKFDTDGDIEDAFGLVCRLEKKIRELERTEKVAAKKAAAEALTLEIEHKQEELISKSVLEFSDDDYAPAELVNKAFELVHTGECEKALGIFLRLATDDIPQAQYICALMYKDGKGVEASKERALFWMEKAAGQGMPEAQYECAMMQTDLKPHIQWLTKAYKQTENAEVREKAEARLKRLGIPVDNL